MTTDSDWCPDTFSGEHQFLPRKYLKRTADADPNNKDDWYTAIACICRALPTMAQREAMEAGLEATRQERAAQRRALRLLRTATEQQPGLM